MDVITYRYLVTFSQYHNLCMHQLDVATSYLYETLDKGNYMEAPPELIQPVNYHSKGEGLQENKKEGLLGHDKRSMLHMISKAIAWISRDQPADDKSFTKRYQLSSQVLASLYRLKQRGRTWYMKFKSEMLAKGFITAEIAPCLFIKHESREFIIVTIYIDDLNLFGTSKIMLETIKLLNRVFETRDMGKTPFCLGLQFKHREFFSTNLPTQGKYSNNFI
jgi:hypothetical protein